ncbi:MAG: thiamine pyrophosphate-binding protein, partial [Nitrososphaerota archaeon]|nr:thiamine pyrophosphate-binding protein [Nitrososphaerota archaeon]
GPVHINLPVDVLARDLDGPEPKISPISRESFRTRPNPDLVGKALEVILSSKQPVIIAGSGVIWSAATPELQEFAELLSIPVINSLSARGALPEDHPLSLGVLWAAVGRTTSKAAVNAMKSTDCLISIGCRLSDVTTNGWSLVPANAKKIQVHNNPAQIGFQYDVEVGIQADPRLFLRDMLAELKNEMSRAKSVSDLWKGSTRLADLASDRKSFFEYLDSIKGSNQVNPWAIIKSLLKLLKRKSIITTGAGTHSWFVGMLPRYLPGTGMKAAGLGTVGFPFPASMGAKLAAPDFQVVSCDGDGGFIATMPDLETAVRHNIEITEVVFNDRSLGAERWKSKFTYGERYYEIDIRAPDYAKVAQNFGARGYRVEKDSELDSVLAEAFNGKGPAVVDILVDPWVSPGIYRLSSDLPASSD